MPNQKNKGRKKSDTGVHTAFSYHMISAESDFRDVVKGLSGEGERCLWPRLEGALPLCSLTTTLWSPWTMSLGNAWPDHLPLSSLSSDLFIQRGTLLLRGNWSCMQLWRGYVGAGWIQGPGLGPVNAGVNVG